MQRLKLFFASALVLVAGAFATTTASCGGSAAKMLFDLGRPDTATAPADLNTTRDSALATQDLAVSAKVAAACTNYCKCDTGSIGSFGSSSTSTSTSCDQDCTSALSSASGSTSSGSTESIIDCLAAASTCAAVNTCLGNSSSS